METKKIQLELPKDLNKQLNLYLIEARDIGVKTTKAELCVKLIRLSINNELKNLKK